jgi:ABC-2 type transport system ATP-binding protein
MLNYVNVENLTKRYGDVAAVDNLSFNVREGEIFGFLGPNGAGKSTTLNVLCTLTEYNKGSITIAGYNLATDERAIKALIGIVPQDIALYATLTSRDNIAFYASLYGLGGRALREAVDDALEFVGLSEQRNMITGN